MTDEATPTGAESAAPAAAPNVEPPKRGSIDALKAILKAEAVPAQAEPAPTGKPDAEAPAAKTEAAKDSTPTEAKAEDADATPVESTEAETPDLAKIAKMLGIAPSEIVLDDDGKVAFRVKVDGQEGKANLNGLRKTHQLESHLTRRLMDASEKEKAIEDARTAFEQERTAKAQVLDQYLDLAKTQLMGELSRVNWDDLRANDPVDWAVKRSMYEERATAIVKALEARKAEHDAAQKAFQDTEAKRLAAEEKLLLTKVPEWNESGTRKAETVALVDWLKTTHGLTDERITAVGTMGHEAIIILRDAKRWHDFQKEQAKRENAVKEKLTAAPKMAKPGQPVPEQGERDKTRSLLTAHKKGDKAAGLAFLKRTVIQKH